MKNILFVRSEYNMNGPGNLALSFARELRRQGYNVVFAADIGTMDEEINKESFVKYNIEGLGTNRDRKKYAIDNIKRIRKILKNENIDAILGFNAISTLLAYIATKVLLKKISIANYVQGEGKEKLLKFLPFKMIVLTEYLKKRLMSFGVSEKRISIIYPSTLDMNKFKYIEKNEDYVRKELGLKKENIIVTSIGMFTGGKGQAEIIEMIPEIVRENNNIYFVFIGDGKIRNNLEKRAQELGVFENISFLGVRKDIPELLNGSDIFVHFSPQETFGMVITEALAMHTPVIAKKVGGIPEIIENEKNGFLVENSKEMIEKVLLLSKDKERRELFVRMGIEDIKNKFDVKISINRLREELEI